MQEAFLRQLGVSWLEAWTRQDTGAAHRLWTEHVTEKRLGQAGRRPVADVFIETFTLRFQGLLTRNPKYFAAVATVVP